MVRQGYTVLVHREGSLSTREWHVPRWLARTVLTVLIGTTVLLALLGVLYGPIVAAASRVPLLERENARLRDENTRVTELARRLDDAEARYAHLRTMLGGDIGIPDPRTASSEAAGAERLYVAPPFLARAPRSASDLEPPGPSAPHRWPLVVASYRTRGLAQGDPSVESHAGLDLAVPVGSEVRASGGGLVRRTGTDSAYGEYVLLAHPDGYETMYGHLSRILVARGATVSAGQLIALSGNTGRSTAPHLHFEVRLYGASVDPLTLVKEGR